MPLPTEVAVIYDKPGYEVRMQPVFSFVFSTDRARAKNDIVNASRLTLETRELKSHDAARKYIEDLLAQFQSGKWKRHISIYCPAVSGRSTYLNLAGEFSTGGCAMDPDYKISTEEWLKLFRTRQYFEWLGDGVISQLSIVYSEDSRGLTYDIDFIFEDYATKVAIIEENEIRRKKNGDAKGWNTTAKAEKNLKEAKENNKLLEANAIKRGDSVIERGDEKF